MSDTWRNLQSIIKQRDAELAQEELRQEDNDKLRREFATHANNSYAWLTDTRQQMMEGSGIYFYLISLLTIYQFE